MKKNILGNKRIIFVGIMAIAVAASATGCDDMTAQQYQNQEAQANFQRIQAEAGVYAGSVTSLDGKTPMGGIQLTIEASAQPVASSDNTTTVSQAKVLGSVRIIGSVQVEAAFSSATIDPNTGKFFGTISVSNPSDSSNPYTMTVQGTISGRDFTGQITSDQFPGNGGNFSSKLNGALPSQQSLSKAGPSDTPDANYYVGASENPVCTSIQDGERVPNGPCQVTLSIIDAPTSSADNFVDFFLTNNDVIINVTSIGSKDSSPASADIPAVVFPQGFGGTSANPATFDQSNKVLQGTAMVTDGSGATMTLRCNEIPVVGNPNGKFGFHCSESSNLGGIYTQFNVYPAVMPVNN